MPKQFLRQLILAWLLLLVMPLALCAATFTGKVIDSMNKPIAGASVTVQISNFPTETIHTINCETDPDGNFQFDAPDELSGDNSYTCWITAPGYAYGGGQIRFVDSNTFKLLKPVEYRGLFVDQDGKPIANKKVSLLEIDTGSTTYSPKLDLFANTSPITAVTDLNGQFRLCTLPPNSTIHVALEGHIDSFKIVLPGDGKPLIAGKVAAITGHVTYGDNSPAPNLRVTIVGQSSSEETTSAKDGNYSLDGLTPGNYRVQVSNKLDNLATANSNVSDWALPITTIVTVKQGDSTITQDIVIRHGALITGTVTDAATGKPIPDADITPQHLDFSPDGVNNFDLTIYDSPVKSDKDGRYAFRTSPGTVAPLATTSFGDYAPQDYDDWRKIAAIEGGTYSADIKLQPGYGAKLHIVDQDGKIPPKLDLTVRPVDQNHTYGFKNTYSPNADGFYEVHNAIPGSYNLQIPGHWKIVSGGKITIPANQPLEVRLSLVVPFSLASRVINPNGEPISGVSLHFTVTPNSNQYEVTPHDMVVTSDGHGKFELPDINPDDKVTVAIAKEGYLLLSGGSVTINNTDAVMSPPIMAVADRTLIGVVKDTDGKPVPNAYVISTIGGPNLPIKTDSTGHFKMSDLPRASFDLIAAKSIKRGRITITSNGLTVYAKIILSDDNKLPKSDDTTKYFAIMEKLIPRINTNASDISWNSIMTDLAPYHPDLGLKEIEDHGQTNMYTYYTACCRAIAVDPVMGAQVVKRLYSKINDPSKQYFVLARAALAVGRINPDLALEFYKICKPESHSDTWGNGVDLIALAYMLHQPDADSLYKTFAAKEMQVEDSKPNQTRQALVLDLAEIAVGDWKKAKELYDDLPETEKTRLHFRINNIVDFDPDEAVEAYKAFNGLTTLTYQSSDSQNTQVRLAGIYAKQNPKAALDFARTFPEGRIEADALLAVADQTAMPDAKAIYQEAFEAVIDNDDRCIGAKIAIHAWQRDQTFGLSLFTVAEQKLVDNMDCDPDGDNGPGYLFSRFDEFAWYIAQADLGFARTLIEKQKAMRSLLPTSTTVLLQTENTDPFDTGYADTNALEIAADAIAMSAINIDDALAMVDDIPNSPLRNAANYQIAEFASATNSVRAKIDFNIWASHNVDFAGAEYGRYY